MIINEDDKVIDILIENKIQQLKSEIGTLKLYIEDEKEYIKKIKKKNKEAEERIKKAEYRYDGKYEIILYNMFDELLECNKNFIKEREKINKKYTNIYRKEVKNVY